MCTKLDFTARIIKLNEAVLSRAKCRDRDKNNSRMRRIYVPETEPIGWAGDGAYRCRQKFNHKPGAETGTHGLDGNGATRGNQRRGRKGGPETCSESEDVEGAFKRGRRRDFKAELETRGEVGLEETSRDWCVRDDAIGRPKKTGKSSGSKTGQ